MLDSKSDPALRSDSVPGPAGPLSNLRSEAHPLRRGLLFGAMLGALGLGLAACGGGEDPPAVAGGGGSSAETNSDGGAGETSDGGGANEAAGDATTEGADDGADGVE